MKKILIVAGVVIAVLLVVGFLFRGPIQMGLFYLAMKPGLTFAEDTRHQAPDYADESAWAALPQKSDMADVLPNGNVQDNQRGAAVDVFFIHPTTYYKPDHWLQPLDDKDANTITDEQVLRNQASVFNSCCAIYAPRYRQATLFAFMDDSGDGEQAIAFAYQDVSRAFDYFLEHYSRGRPFIIAGHSQGGKHADTLLRERIVGTELESRLVAAYPVGYFIDAAGSVPVCQHATQAGCQVTWNAMSPDAQLFQETAGSICVNPLNWRADESRADFAENIGAVSFQVDGDIEPEVADAQCSEGRLLVSEVRSANYSTEMFGPGNYHVYDFSFYHMNIRANALDRVAAYLAGN